MLSQTSPSKQERPTLLIIKHFYKLKAAEHEVVERLVASTEELGWNPRVVEVDADFHYRDIQKVEKGVHAVLDIHYEYPKFFKAKSIGAFWTPTSFMKDWDLAYVWENQLSHDNLVYTDSKRVLELLNEFRPDEYFGILNHSLPGSWLAWINSAQRSEKPSAFYAGINWNKLSGRPGRHHELFKMLDDENILDIYGPRKISHVVPWKGFKSYRGEIPFDGKSILRKARESGISLVLSAEQHLAEGVISSRFFEGLAAGNAIISDGHPFIIKHLGKNGFNLNLERGDTYAADQLRDFVSELRQNPALLKSQQDFAQDLFLEKFDLTKQLKKILKPEIQIESNVSLDALVLGISSNDLHAQLMALGFQRIEHSNVVVIDLQDLLSLARSFELTQFCVFYANTEVLDGFAPALSETSRAMKKQGSQFGIVPTVILSQGGRKFSPVVVGQGGHGSVPLNGLVVNLNLKEPSFVRSQKKIPYLRIHELSEFQQISNFFDTFSFLRDVGRNKNVELGVREQVRREFQTRYLHNQSDVAEEIRLLPRSRRRVLGYSLIAAMPYMKPFSAVIKWFIRKRS
jgi:hypothetical protein